jgi:hypothetical protein
MTKIPGPGSLVRWMDPRIRIRTIMSWIRGFESLVAAYRGSSCPRVGRVSCWCVRGVRA